MGPRERVARGFERVRATGIESILVAVHKGVVRTILELASGYTLAPGEPELGGVVQASRGADGRWYTGRIGSDATVSEAGTGIRMDEVRR